MSQDGWIRWGRPPAPLLPQSLRRGFASRVLPVWVSRKLGLPDGATALALDGAVWDRLESLPPRAEEYILGFVGRRLGEVAELRLMQGPWPKELSTRSIPWPKRVRTCLEAAGLLDGGGARRLEKLTFGELRGTPGLGIRSLLDVAVIVEILAARSSAVLPREVKAALGQAAGQEWARRIEAADPRLGGLVPRHTGTLAEMFQDAIDQPSGLRATVVAEALPAIRARAAEITVEPLDRALRRYLVSVGVSNRNADIVAARQGWSGEAPQTLQTIGEAMGVTRERIRQIVDSTLERVTPVYMPQLERAVQAIARRTPLAASDAGKVLVAEGISSVPIAAEGLESAAALFGYELPYRSMPLGEAAYLITDGMPDPAPVRHVARRKAGRVGVSNVDEVRAGLDGLGQAGAGHPAETIRRLLASFPQVEFLDDEWFWMPGIPTGSNRLRNVTRRMLSVTPRLNLPALRQGVRRVYRFKGIKVVPPLSVLRAFYGAHPEFVLNGDETVEPVKPLDYRRTLGEVERALVEVLRASPVGMMHRADLERAMIERGVNASTFSTFASYSPILERPAPALWCLRGQPLSETIRKTIEGAAERSGDRQLMGAVARVRQVDGTDRRGMLEMAALIESVRDLRRGRRALRVVSDIAG